MAYIINKFNGEQLVVLEDGTIDTTTSLGLVGRNYVGYGETQNENFVFLLENFANDAPPTRPLTGQLWYNTSNGALNVYDGDKWVFAAGIKQSPTPPADSTTFWLRTPDKALHVWTGSDWTFIGPESLPGFGITRARSATLEDQQGNPRPVIFLEVDDIVTAVCCNSAFSINFESYLSQGLSQIPFDLQPGINFRNDFFVTANLIGNATSANKLTVPRTINGIGFDGQNNISIKSSTTNFLRKGSYILGSDFDGTVERTWAVDATSFNAMNKVVARNGNGDFAAGTITADLVGNVTGNVTSDSGTSTFDIVQATTFVGATLTGTANAARQLANNPKINGVTFTGLTDVLVPAAADTLIGSTLASNITISSLTNLGVLNDLEVTDFGIRIGGAGAFKLFVDSAIPTIRSSTGNLNFDLGVSGPDISFINSTVAGTLGGPAAPAIIGNNAVNIGIPSSKFINVYATNFKGTDVEVSSITPVSPGGSITANGNFIITGDLTIQGSTTTISSSELAITDKLISLAVGSINSAAANGAGVFIEGAGAALTYASSGDKWVMNKRLDMGSNDVVTTGLFQGTATSAQYADLAENYVADKDYDVGTVLEIGGSFEVTVAKEESTSIAGIVSAAPAYLMNSACKGNNVATVALIGRVPCKVLGPIKKGDLLVSAGNGRAKTGIEPRLGSVIGKALEDFADLEGFIEVLVGRL